MRPEEEEVLAGALCCTRRTFLLLCTEGHGPLWWKHLPSVVVQKKCDSLTHMQDFSPNISDWGWLHPHRGTCQMQCSLLQESVQKGEGWLSNSDLSCQNTIAKHIHPAWMYARQAGCCPFPPLSFVGKKHHHQQPTNQRILHLFHPYVGTLWKA